MNAGEEKQGKMVHSVWTFGHLSTNSRCTLWPTVLGPDFNGGIRFYPLGPSSHVIN